MSWKEEWGYAQGIGWVGACGKPAQGGPTAEKSPTVPVIDPPVGGKGNRPGCAQIKKIL